MSFNFNGKPLILPSLNKPPNPKVNVKETMNNFLGSDYQIVNVRGMDPVVLTKLPDEDLAPKNDDDNIDDEELTIDTLPESSPTPPPSPKPEKTTDDYIFHFYLGSLTVVGLFILFRMIQKSK